MPADLELHSEAKTALAQADDELEDPVGGEDREPPPEERRYLGPIHAEDLTRRGLQGAPHSPWQRGSNENTNGLLRQFLPLTDDFNALTRRDLNKIARELNNRPRQTLNWMKPSEVFSLIVASTG